MPLVSVIIPVYNESENIPELYPELTANLPPQHEILWIDDGSKDDSLSRISLLARHDGSVKCISFSRNFGHQNAIFAGLQYARGDWFVIMDSDFQHPPSLLPQMLGKLREGYDLVSAKRNKTENIGLFKKALTSIYYKLINFLSDTNIEENVADFRVFNSKVKNSILQFNERELFLRGIFSWIGFKTCYINFDAPARRHGDSKYSFSKMFRLGLKGTTSFSFRPLRISLMLGTIVSVVAFILAINSVIAYYQGRTVPGWASLMVAVVFLGGIQLLVVGLLGEYIASLFIESKKRPLFLISEKINIEE